MAGGDRACMAGGYVAEISQVAPTTEIGASTYYFGKGSGTSHTGGSKRGTPACP